MEYQIKIQPSIKNKRVFYQRSLWLVIHRILFFFTSLLTLAILIFGFVVAVFQSAIIFSLFMIILSVWMVLNLIFANKLTEINCCDQNKNRRLILKLLNERYHDLNIKDTCQSVIVDFRPSGAISNGRVITVIFNADDLYINIQVLFRDSSSPYHGLITYLRCRTLKNEFLRLAR
jgi:hypothetical protein